MGPGQAGPVLPDVAQPRLGRGTAPRPARRSGRSVGALSTTTTRRAAGCRRGPSPGTRPALGPSRVAMTTVASAGGCADATVAGRWQVRPVRAEAVPKSCTDQLRGEHGLVQRELDLAHRPSADRHQAQGARVRRLVAAPRVDRRQRSSEVDRPAAAPAALAGSSIGDRRASSAGASGAGSSGPTGSRWRSGRARPRWRRPGDAGQVTVQGPAEVAQHAGRQHPPDVAGLAGQRGRATHPARDAGLGDALGPAAVREVAPGRRAGRGRGGARRPRGSYRKTPSGNSWPARMQSSVSSQPSGCRRVRPSPVSKPPTAAQDRTAQRHVAAHQVADRRRRGRLAAIAAAHDPAELTRPPGRLRGLPDGGGRAADAEDSSGRRTGRAGACSSPASAAASSSRKQTMSPVEAAMPVLRAPERPWARRVRPAPWPPGRRPGRRASRASLWSMTTTISSTGRRWACTEVTAWQSWSQRVLGVGADDDRDVASVITLLGLVQQRRLAVPASHQQSLEGNGRLGVDVRDRGSPPRSAGRRCGDRGGAVAGDADAGRRGRSGPG